MLIELKCLRHVRAQRIDREIEVNGARIAALSKRSRDRLVEFLRDETRFTNRACITRQRPDEFRVRHVLQRSAILLGRSEEHTSELQSHVNLVCRLLLEKKKKKIKND